MISILSTNFIFPSSNLCKYNDNPVAPEGSVSHKILEHFNIITTNSVVRELEDFAKHEDELANTAKSILKLKDKFR